MALKKVYEHLENDDHTLNFIKANEKEFDYMMGVRKALSCAELVNPKIAFVGKSFVEVKGLVVELKKILAFEPQLFDKTKGK